MSKDYQLRPNSLNPTGTGPGRDGFKVLVGLFNTFTPDIIFERQLSLLCGGDKVVVVSYK